VAFQVGGLLKATVLATAIGFAGTSSVNSETLEDALVAAYNTNPNLAAERARLRSIDEGLSQALAGWRPTVTLNGSYGVTDRRSAPSFGSPNQSLHPIQGSATVTQTIFNGLQTLYSVRQSNAEIRAGREALRSVEQDTLLGTVTAYMDVLRDQAVVDLNKNNVEVLKRQLEAAQDRFNVGEITRTDVAQAEARLSRAVSNLTASEADLIGSRAAYGRVVGQSPATLAPPPALPPLPGTEEEALAIALESNPNLINARESETASRYAVTAAKGALWPTISIQGQLAHSEDSSVNGSQSDSQEVTAQISVPLYQAGAEWSRIRQARHVNSQNVANIAATQRQVTEGVTNSWEGLRSARATIVSDREQVRANEIALDGVEQEAKVGSRTTLDVLDAEQELLDARVALVRSERNEYVAAFQLLSSIGQLDARRLNLPANYYDPTKNYRTVKWKLIGWDIDD